MKLLYEKPPLYGEIAAAFPAIIGRQVFFAWGKVIYAPHRPKELPPNIEVHEMAHGVRQLAVGIEDWWRKYIADAQFRLDEELIAHAAEYDKLCQMEPSRRERRGNLAILASKLANPIYGGMIGKAEAKARLRDAVEALRGQVDAGG